MIIFPFVDVEKENEKSSESDAPEDTFPKEFDSYKELKQSSSKGSPKSLMKTLPSIFFDRKTKRRDLHECG